VSILHVSENPFGPRSLVSGFVYPRTPPFYLYAFTPYPTPLQPRSGTHWILTGARRCKGVQQPPTYAGDVASSKRLHFETSTPEITQRLYSGGLSLPSANSKTSSAEWVLSLPWPTRIKIDRVAKEGNITGCVTSAWEKRNLRDAHIANSTETNSGNA
jgi:hypothetical protein